MGCTEDLATFVAECRFDKLTPDVVDGAKKCVLDWIGVALGAAGDPAVAILLRVVRALGGNKQASVLGHRLRTTVPHAALVNGTMSHTLDYDDAHSGVRTHPSAPLVPALLAVAEHRGLPGRDLITAFVSGYEATVRVGYALGKEYYERGWHATSVLGRIGAAAGTARLLGLNAEQTAVALGLAATQAGGVRDVFGTMGKPFHAGKAAMDGLLSALLAGEGFTAPIDMLDGGHSFGSVFTSGYDPDAIGRGLGVEYRLWEVNFKPYAACLLVHPVVDAGLAIRKEHRVDPDAIEEIHVRTAPLNLKVTGDHDPQTSFQAKFSLPMAAALALVHGGAGERLFTDAVLGDRRVREVMGKVQVQSDSSMAETEAVMTLVMRDGCRYSSHIVSPKGDPGNPMTFSDIEEKVRDLAGKILSRRSLDRVVDLIQGLEVLENTATLVRLCCPGPRLPARSAVR